MTLISSHLLYAIELKAQIAFVHDTALISALASFGYSVVLEPMVPISGEILFRRYQPLELFEPVHDHAQLEGRMVGPNHDESLAVRSYIIPVAAALSPGIRSLEKLLGFPNGEAGSAVTATAITRFS